MMKPGTLEIKKNPSALTLAIFKDIMRNHKYRERPKKEQNSFRKIYEKFQYIKFDNNVPGLKGKKFLKTQAMSQGKPMTSLLVCSPFIDSL